jgi:hypothetical protein
MNDSKLMKMFSKSFNIMEQQYEAMDGLLAEIEHLKLVDENNEEEFKIYYESLVACEDRAYKHAKIVDTLLNCIREFDELTLSEDEVGFKWGRK